MRGEGVISAVTGFKEQERENLRREAVVFILNKSTEPFSYLWLCEQIDADPNYIKDAYEDGSIKDWQIFHLRNGDDEASESGITFTKSIFPLKRAS